MSDNRHRRPRGRGRGRGHRHHDHHPVAPPDGSGATATVGAGRRRRQELSRLEQRGDVDDLELLRARDRIEHPTRPIYIHHLEPHPWDPMPADAAALVRYGAWEARPGTDPSSSDGEPNDETA